MALLTSQTREWRNGNNVSCAPLRATLLRRDTQELVVVCAKRKKTNYLTKNNWNVFIHWCPFCMGSNWRWRSQVGIWSSVSFVNWLSSTLRLREQDLANPTPLDTANHWKPGHESAGKFWDATMPTHWHCCTTACWHVAGRLGFESSSVPSARMVLTWGSSH